MLISIIHTKGGGQISCDTGCVDSSGNDLTNNNTNNWNREFIRNHIKSSDLSYASKRIRWSNSFESLQYFVENAINEQGKWSSKIDSQVLYRIFILHGITTNKKLYSSRELLAWI